MVDCCCCCIPIRLGTILLAALLLVSSAVNSYVVLGRSEMMGREIDDGLRVFFGIIYIFVAIISFLGIIGSSLSSRRYVRLFANLLWFLFIGYIVISIVQVVEIFQHKSDRINDCIGDVNQETDSKIGQIGNSTSDDPLISKVANSTTSQVDQKIDQNTPEYCRKAVNIAIGAIVVWYVLINLILIYFCNVATRFARQLESENRHHKLRNHTYGTRSANRPSTSVTSVTSLEYPQSGNNQHGKGKA